MKLRSVRAQVVAVAAIGCALAGCAVRPKDDALPSRIPMVSRAAVQFEQVAFGRGAVFAACRGAECPRVTPKTFASAASAPMASAVPASLVAHVDVPERRSSEVRAPGAPDQSLPVREPSGSDGSLISVDRREPTPVFASAVLSDSTDEFVTVNFAVRGVMLDARAKDSIVELMPRVHLAERIVIAGRTDNVGGTTTNNTIALARALAVRRYMLERAPDLAPKLAIHAKGGCCFVASNDSAEGRALNRRVEIMLRGKV